MAARVTICSLLISVIFGQNIIDTHDDHLCIMDTHKYHEAAIITNICVDLIEEFNMSFIIDCDANSVTYSEYTDAECKIATDGTDLFKIEEGCDDPWKLNAYVQVKECDDANYIGGGSGGKAASVNYTDCEWFGSNMTNAPILPVGVCTAHSHEDEMDQLTLYSTKYQCTTNGEMAQYEYNNTGCSGNPYNTITYRKEDGYFSNCGSSNNVLPSCPFTKIKLIELVNQTSSGGGSTPTPTPTPTIPGPSPYANADIGCNYVNFDGVAMPIDYCMAITYQGRSLHMKFVCSDTWDSVTMEAHFGQDCDGMVLKSIPMSNYSVGFYCSSSYDESTCDEVSINAYQDDCSSDAPIAEARLITDQCLYADTNTFMKLQCSEDSTILNTYHTATGDCSDSNLINSTQLNEGSEDVDGQEIGCILIEGCESGVIMTETPTKNTLEPTPSPTRSPIIPGLITFSPTAKPVVSPYASQDIGCNYVDLMGGVAMPVDYCMDVVIEKGQSMELGVKLVCSDTWDSVSAEVYASKECDGFILESIPVSSNQNISAGFYCSPKYKSTYCDEVSINVYLDSDCSSGSYAELRVITDECIYAGDGIFNKLECTGNSATASMYHTTNGDCSSANLINSTSLSNEGGEDIDGEDIGCIKVESCTAASSSDDSSKASTVVYIVITILVVILIAVVIILAQRHYYKKKMQNVEVLNSNIGDATGIMAVPTTDMDDIQPQVIFASDDALASIDPIANTGGEDKEDALLSAQMVGNE